MNERTDAMINGALMVIDAAAVIDNILFYWILGWYRLIEGVPDPAMFLVELTVVLIGTVLFAIGG